MVAGTLRVWEIMTKAVKTVGVDANVREVVQKMSEFKIGSIVVVEGKKPVGIVTERDILQKIVAPCVDPNTVGVKEIMSSPLVTANPDFSVEKAARLMAKRKIKTLPIVEDDELVGIVTSMDLIRAAPKLVELLEDLLDVGRYWINV